MLVEDVSDEESNLADDESESSMATDEELAQLRVGHSNLSEEPGYESCSFVSDPLPGMF